MEMMTEFLQSLTPWHWLALGLVLIGIEVLIGTFDLLWIGVAALLTALYASGLIPIPAEFIGWQGQLIAFAGLSIVLLVIGRTLLAGLRKPTSSHPALNRRADSMIGQRAVVASDFSGGAGRIKLGDTTWSAQSEFGDDLSEGEAVIVESAKSATLIVRRA